MNIYKIEPSKEEETLIDLDKIDCIKLTIETSGDYTGNFSYWIYVYINGNKIYLNHYALDNKLKALEDYNDIVYRWKLGKELIEEK